MAKQKTTKAYLLDSTFVPALAPLLFAGGAFDIERRNDAPKAKHNGDPKPAAACLVVLDGHLRFKMSEEAAVLAKKLRSELDRVLRGKIEAPGAESGAGPVVEAVVALLTSELGQA